MLNIKKFVFLLLLTVLSVFFMYPDPDLIRIFWPIRTQEKKSDPDPANGPGSDHCLKLAWTIFFLAFEKGFTSSTMKMVASLASCWAPLFYENYFV